MRAAILLTLPMLAAAAPVAPGEVDVDLTGLRSAKGRVLACLTTEPRGFPDCRRDPSARSLAIPAGQAHALHFGNLPAGRYAVSLLHDENGNGRADMALMLPREGFGFSRDAPLRFGPPKFKRAAFAVGTGTVTMPIRMRYFL